MLVQPISKNLLKYHDNRVCTESIREAADAATVPIAERLCLLRSLHKHGMYHTQSHRQHHAGGRFF
jgi:type III secretory pathway component EscU